MKTAIRNHQIRAVLPVLRADGYVGLLESILWILFFKLMSTYLTFG